MATKRLPTATKKRTARKTDVISGSADPTESIAADLLPQEFLELAPDAIIVADGEGRILLVNHQTEVLFGYARSELLGVPVELLLQTLLGELPGGAYLVYGRQGKLVMANRAAMGVFGAIWPEGLPMPEFLQSSGVRIFSETGRLLSPDESAKYRRRYPVKGYGR